MRLFVAAYPPAGSARAMLSLPGLPDRSVHRVVSPEQVHMTLQFIGDTKPRELDDVLESVRRSTSGIGPFLLRARELLSLPERGEARLVALTTDAPPELLELQRRLAARLARNPRDRQRFLPHFTLCRFRAGSTATRIRREAVLPGFTIGHIVLMESVLRPGGAEHREVERFSLEA